MSPKKIQLLLLDANIVIKLNELDLWPPIVERCEVVIAETVVAEAQYCEGSNGKHKRIDLPADVKAGTVKVVNVSLAELLSFRSLFKPGYVEMLDDGEAESLAYMCKSNNEHIISSADKIVWRVLGALAMRDRGLSLEEILQKCGVGKPLEDMYSKRYREAWTAKGFQEAMDGSALAKRN